MGCGTGVLGQADQYTAILTFNRPISSQDAVYIDFKSALFWLLQGLPTRGGMGNIEEVPVGPLPKNITGLKVTVNGPLNSPEHFNRAFNRLLWGVRHRLSDGNVQRPGTNSTFSVTAKPEDWPDEDT
ncbi:MAG: hypothetical protein ACREJ6_09765 [Candidatus Methylomirabilis sp.]